MTIKKDVKPAKVMQGMAVANKDDSQMLFSASTMESFQIGAFQGIIFAGSEGAAAALEKDPRVEAVKPCADHREH